MEDKFMFKVGDIVTVIKPYGQSPWGNRKGETGTITSIEPKTALWGAILHVSFADDAVAFYSSQVEPAKNHIVTQILNDL